MQNSGPVRCTAGRKIVSIALIFKKNECLGKMTQKSCIIRFFVGESPSWLRHRILIPACEGSSPSSPAKFDKSRGCASKHGFFFARARYHRLP